MAWAETLAFVKLPVLVNKLAANLGVFSMAIDHKWCNETSILLLKKSRNLRGVKKVEARDVASPTSLLKEIIWPRPLRELGNWGQTWFEYSIYNAWEISVDRCTPLDLEESKMWKLWVSMFTFFWCGTGDAFLDSVSRSQDIRGFYGIFKSS